ncbi:MAG TPA: mannitol dehydrogenase family protein [Acidimicrobiales bacterium]|nr:mannitol dehydrogenase family protein [Acidimicrobiales bacterium]
MNGSGRLSSIRLRDAALPDIAARGVPVPTYDRRRLEPRILHVGVGGFHRAHLALYTHELAEAGSDWGIRGIGLLRHDVHMAQALAPQDHLYTLIERGGGDPRSQIVGSIIDYRLAHDQPARAAELAADPGVAILSLTITEAGYGDGAGAARSSTPTTFDVIAMGLERRRKQRYPPLTIVSCDNLPRNGDAARRLTLAAARRRDASLVDWTDRHCAFPNSMVDRITPATSDADRAWLLDSVGVEDRWPVVAEPFRQWVIEDEFANGRPRWEDVGVLFTDRVHDWEIYKLRLLNAGHSSMAYLAALAGITYVDEAMALPEVRRFLHHLLHDEAVPTLTQIPGHPPGEYVATVLERFANTGVHDQIARLCIDGSAKFPTFLLPTITLQLEHDGPIAHAALALAGWARYLATVPRNRQAFDASGDAARRHARRATDEPTRFLDFAEVFSTTLRDSARFRVAFATAWQRLGDVGPLVAMGE